MRQGGQHLTVEEILLTLFEHPLPEDDSFEREINEHLVQCEHCRQVKEEYRDFMSKLYEFGKMGAPGPRGPCPSPGSWAELAAGVLPEEAAFRQVQHAGTCPSCAQELQYAIQAVAGNEPPSAELQKQLVTATEEWQRKFAEKLATQGVPASSAMTAAVRGPFKRFIGRPWAMVAVAAAVVLAAGASLMLWKQRASADSLIRQAYAQQRTIEMRIPGAGYGPIQVERANGRSPINSPRVLLEAEVMIKGGLEKAPNDPELLRQKAEADLLTWNYQPAIETLNRAIRIRPGSFALLVDLATAYFERAEASSSPADYETGLQYLGDAIKLEPSNPAALFNRAILYERLYFYDRAIADWEQFLKIERDPGWKQEAGRRLTEIRARMKERGLRQSPSGLPPGRFEQEVKSGQGAVIEEFLEAAQRNILPLIVAPRTSDENYRAAEALARQLESAHDDPFLRDLLRGAGERQFQEAAGLLGESSMENHRGHFEQARGSAARAASIFRKTGNSAGWLAALFEQSYALQFEAQAGACREIARSAATDARRLGYAFLEAQLLLEHAICSNMSGDLGTAKEGVRSALDVARSHDFQSLYLRGLTLLATLETDAGDDASAWSAVKEGLALYWKSDLPPVRAYSFYAALDRMAERLGHANVQFAASSEALGFRGDTQNRVVEAAAHARLGSAALRIGNLTVAGRELQKAQRIFSSEPQSDSVRWRELEARIQLARVESLRGSGSGQPAATLEDAAGEVRRLSNRYLEFVYYDTLAEVQLREGNTQAARESLERAIGLAEAGARSLTSWREKLAWMEQHRSPYIQMTGLLLDSGEEEQSLAQWQMFRAAGDAESPASVPERGMTGLAGADLEKRISASASASSMAAWSSPETRILTYAVTPDRIMIWVRGPDGTHGVSMPVSARELQRTAESFIGECSRPDSDLANLQADARLLYSWLIGPVQRWLPPSGRLTIEPDGVLGRIPLEALMDEESSYLGSNYTITVALTLRAAGAETGSLAASSLQRALIVAAPAASEGLAAPPGAVEEAQRVAGYFGNSELLAGRDASVARVEKEIGRVSVFHFAGHAMHDRSGAAMLLADGALGLEFRGDGRRLNGLQLAVLSACGTARPGEVLESRSLVSEFLHAGARHVVASRWNVDSVATADFIAHFYRSVFSGASVARSMQTAASDFRKTRERSHPYYWAAFTAFGSA